MTLTYPGVYVQEVPSGVRPIAGVSTGTTLFVGACGRGPLDDPTLVLSHAEFVEAFGDDPTVSDMSRQVRLFFLNGGRTAYVMRIAHGATPATVTLQNAAGVGVLDVSAAEPGVLGEQIRLRVTPSATAPDATFDLDVFRYSIDAAGTRTPAQPETFTGLSMDPTSSRYAPTVLTQSSAHIDATEAGTAPAAGNGAVVSGLAVPWLGTDDTTFRAQWAALVGTAGPPAAEQTLELSVDGGDPVTVDLSGIDVGGLGAGSVVADLATAVGQAVTDAHTAVGRPGVTVAVSFDAGPVITTPDDALHGGSGFDTTSYLRVASTTGGDITVSPTTPLSQRLRLGVSNGGREISAHADRRPAPNAAVLDGTDPAIGAMAHAAVTSLTLDGEVIPIPASPDPGRPFFVPLAGGYPTGRGGLDGVTERLRVIRDAVNGHAATTPTFRWAAAVWGARLVLWRTAGADNATNPGDLATAPTDLAGSLTDNTRLYTLGVSGADTGFQDNPAVVATDGTPPTAADYDAAYTVVEREVDLVNLVVLPADNRAGAVDRATLWGSASVFCRRNRAFLLVDPPPTWTDHTTPVDGTGVNDAITDLRTGVVTDHAAVHHPNLLVDEGGRRAATAPSGAIAGLMARIDETRGVWKAAAGTEAGIRGVVGVQRVFSDAENGVLNPQAINTIRRFPTGIVNWGARTMAGFDSSGSEFAYVPVRRLFLYLEESIYRGLQWTVFEPNGLDLWAAIRLNVGNFLNGLYRQGAFAGSTVTDAYYVKCDAETTTPTDRALGIVNVHIGVATLKPAEFIVLSFRQVTLPER